VGAGTTQAPRDGLRVVFWFRFLDGSDWFWFLYFGLGFGLVLIWV
jgi:hypothetical protein